MAVAVAVAVWGMSCGVAHGDDNIDSEHLFGFTEGTDIGKKGDRELELEGHGRFGKQGEYAALSGVVAGKFTITDVLRIAPSVSASHHHIVGVPGLADLDSGSFESASLELKYRLLDRQKAPFGFTVGVIPAWARIDAASGQPVREFGTEFLVSFDKALVPGQLFAAVNFTYELSTSRARATGVTAQASAIGASGALAMQVANGVFLGGELRYARAYGGLGLDRFAGHALFAGPTLYVKLPGTAWIAAGWNIQVAGRASGMGGSLDLENFERHEVKVRFGHGF